MSTLQALWILSLSLSAVALAVMAGLIIARRVSDRRQQARDAERRRLLPLLLAMEGGLQRLAVAQRAPDLLTDLSVELVQLVRGRDKEALVASAADAGVPERLRDRLEATSSRKRLLAAEALVDFADEVSREGLKQALQDGNADVRLTAAISLATIGEAPPADELIRTLGIGRSETSLLIVTLFGEIAKRNPEQIRALILDSDQSPPVKAAAVEALSASGDYSLVPVIAGLTAEADLSGEVHARYLRALGTLAHPAGAEAVTRGFASEHWQVRVAAAEAAGKIGLVDASPSLGQLLDDHEWWVRFRAAEALTRLGEPGVETLRAATSASGERAREAATQVLAEKDFH